MEVVPGTTLVRNVHRNACWSLKVEIVKESGIQDEGGSCWGISQGEIEDMLASGKPLPDTVQHVIDERQEPSALPACRTTTPHGCHYVVPPTRAEEVLTFSSCSQAKCRSAAGQHQGERRGSSSEHH